MKNRVLVTLLVIALFFVFLLKVSIVNAVDPANDTMKVEVDLLGFTPPPPFVGIEVPDYVYLGNLTKKSMQTDDKKIYVNNTGNVNITVTPALKDNSEEIFSYLYFQRRTADPWRRLGNWSLDIAAPTTKSYEDEYFYMKLDLRDYNQEISHDIIGHKSDILFIAMAG